MSTPARSGAGGKGQAQPVESEANHEPLRALPYHVAAHGRSARYTDLGCRFGVPQGGADGVLGGWRDRMGTRMGSRNYLVLEMADLDVLPELFGVGTVTFKAGSEFPPLNRLLGGAAALRARTGHPRLEAYTPLVRGLSWLVGRFGKEAGGVIFEVTGRRGGRPQRQAIAVVAEDDGGRIPAVLAGMAVQELLAGRLATPSPISCSRVSGRSEPA
jgi:hypothetical protein